MTIEEAINLNKQGYEIICNDGDVVGKKPEED